MATVAARAPTLRNDDRFFAVTALFMAAIVFVGFGLTAAMGRSSFGAPPIVHAHALVFMGWVVLYVLQTVFVARRSITLHKWLGWVGAGWMITMVILGLIVTLRMVQGGFVPFVFTPLTFLMMDATSIVTFAGLTTAAIVLRRHTQWHRRLHFAGMSLLLGPAIGRLLPLPLLIPYSYEAVFVMILIFPVIGIVADVRRTRRVHPAALWGIGTIIASTLLVEVVVNSPVGDAVYRGVTAGTPGADKAPRAFPPFPGPPSAHP